MFEAVGYRRFLIDTVPRLLQILVVPEGPIYPRDIDEAIAGAREIWQAIDAHIIALSESDGR